VTRDLVRRVYQHKTKATPGFTSRYGVVHLVWFEVHDDATNAITREKEIKKWRRTWKLEKKTIRLGAIFMRKSHSESVSPWIPGSR
jgi:predicted GIY-YIG superfamily endonuclease